jgi:hypothetical protein
MVFSTDEKRKRVTQAGFFDVYQKSELSSNMAQFHLFLQLAAPIPGAVKPYVEVLGGGNLLWTDATVKLVDDDDSDFEDNNNRFKRDDSFSDFTWSYGAGAGILVKIVPLPTLDLYLDLKARYTRGGEAEFVTLDETEVDFDNGKITFTPKTAFTELMTFHLGVSLFF